VIEEIKTWILNFVSVHNETIGTVPCPFAKQAMAVDKIQYTKVDAVTTASTLIDLIEGGIQRYF
jgi:FPC/CPF motif-containing protein YcgG